MHRHQLNFTVSVVLTIAMALTLAPSPVFGQTRPDFSGLWDGERNSSDLVEYMKAAGSPVPFTAAAAERYKKVDFSKNPNGFCLPPGPSRAITGPSPFQIVQTSDVISFLFENHGIYRIIYMDGRQHPADIMDYPAFMGHSIGKWEGDALVVDTIGINDRTWLDSNGIEHSVKLHLTERFRKVGPDTIQYVVTYDDPEFFTKPWTMTLNLVRQPKGDRLLEYVCRENEKDNVILQPTFENQDKVLQ
jgi:hypothetical protein